MVQAESGEVREEMKGRLWEGRVEGAGELG